MEHRTISPAKYDDALQIAHELRIRIADLEKQNKGLVKTLKSHREGNSQTLCRIPKRAKDRSESQ